MLRKTELTSRARSLIQLQRKTMHGE